MQNTTETVIARYQTVAGTGTTNAELTVDIINKAESHGLLTVICRGCTWIDPRATNGLWSDTPEQTDRRIAQTLPAARQAAQRHAETCRALPTNA